MRAYLRSLNPQLPRDVWILQAGGLANMFGNGVIGPFLIIYLHNVRGLSLAAAGLIAASNALAALVSGPLAGALSDRVGPRQTLVGSLTLMAVAISLFPLIHETWQAFALNALLGFGSGGFWPSELFERIHSQPITSSTAVAKNATTTTRNKTSCTELS